MSKIVEIAPGVRLVPRAAWEDAGRYPRLGHKVARDKRTHVFVHHTVMPDRDDSPNIWEDDAEIFGEMRKLQTVRGRDLGYDVPYSFAAFVTPIGLTICEGRGEDRTGAHSRGHNTASIGIAFAGNFHDEAIDPVSLVRAMQALSRFLGWLKNSASHPDYGDYPPMVNLASKTPPNSERVVWAHRDIKATACPGDTLFRHLKSVDFAPPYLKDIPRRARLEQNSEAELAIRTAATAVAETGSDPLLTEAINLLGQAREKVADFVDGVCPGA